MQNETEQWIQTIKARQLGGALRLLLDITEPISPLAAQILWAAQPAAAVFGARDALGKLAETLDTPGGVDELRRMLED